MPATRRINACTNCGAVVRGMYVSSLPMCSSVCRQDYKRAKLIGSLTELVGEPIETWLRQKYVDEVWSYRDLRIALGLKDVHHIRRLLVYYGIPLRKAITASELPLHQRRANHDAALAMARDGLDAQGNQHHTG